MSEFDPGPPPALASHFDDLPSFSANRELFWYDWGPIFYRGRLDGSAKVIGIASDPGPTERVAARTLVGDAGQRVQGFLAKLGLTRSYVLVNAFAYAVFPSRLDDAKPLLNRTRYKRWRNKLYDDITGPSLQAIVAFGSAAQEALRLWSPRPDVPVFRIPHPSSRDPDRLVHEWRDAITELRGIVTPDPGGNQSLPNYGTAFQESDYARIPPRDLPFGVPAWLGDDAAGRTSTPRRNNSVDRDRDDLLHRLIWRAPENTP